MTVISSRYGCSNEWKKGNLYLGYSQLCHIPFPFYKPICKNMTGVWLCFKGLFILSYLYCVFWFKVSTDTYQLSLFMTDHVYLCVNVLSYMSLLICLYFTCCIHVCIVYVCVCVCVCVWVWVCMYVCVRMYVCVHVCVYTHAVMSLCIEYQCQYSYVYSRVRFNYLIIFDR